MSIDLSRARAETPGCAHVTHFNNAGAALMPQPVLDAVMAHLELEARIGGYEAARQQDEAHEQVYDDIARLIGAQRDEIALFENSTRAWDMAFYSIPFKAGDRILTSAAEYASNFIAFLQLAKKAGVEITVVPNDEHGQISLSALRAAMDERVKLIALTHVPTNGGLVNPAEEVGAIAKEAGVLYLLDACQSVGQLPIDVEAIGCDFLSATGRKYLRGPRGTGFLYVSRRVLDRLEPAMLDLHAATWTHPDRYEIRQDARRFESWESSLAGRLGLGAAVRYALDWGLENIEERIVYLAERLRGALSALPGVTVHDQGLRRCGIVSFTVRGHEPLALRDALSAQGLNLSTSSMSSTRLDMEARQLEAILRASVHYYNTEAEIEALCGTLCAQLTKVPR
ncbi:aminotransferase class V-fold PLP-dependent enzyme [bacterium]|nr:aminotransferase class V-fold PLP-dependent enzyme [bacterium]